MRESWAVVGAGSAPLNPPTVTTAWPVSMMTGAVVIEPLAATRYFAEPWCASSQETSEALIAPPPGPLPANPPPPSAPGGGLDVAAGAAPPDGPGKAGVPPPGPPKPLLTPAGPTCTSLAVSDRP